MIIPRATVSQPRWGLAFRSASSGLISGFIRVNPR